MQDLAIPALVRHVNATVQRARYVYGVTEMGSPYRVVAARSRAGVFQVRSLHTGRWVAHPEALTVHHVVFRPR